ncbi:MAG: phospholipid carrier-dependent glycosyltransferase [Betaproteobacteria bacterium]
MKRSAPTSEPAAGPTWGWGVLLALAVAIYALGLGNPYIPTNGDEMVYAHIARLTAGSGHWLPLVSELDQMRNTKPPLLFWQALVAGDWGRHWTLAALRTPSLVYTLLLAAMVAATVQGITRSAARAALAACVYLAFFSTFRYGRPFLTSAPETFWLSLPLFWLLWQRLRQPAGTGPNAAPGWWAHTAFGLAIGLGLAYKSFALVAPAAAALWCARLATEPALNARMLARATLQVAWSASLALALFGLWFVLDPDPRAVWQEFVLAENAGKMASPQGYWQVALRGGDASMAAQLLAYVQNAGLLAFVVLGLLPAALARWRAGRSGGLAPLPPHARILLVWLGVWLLVFMLPSQRSARYLIPAMPALACVLALGWQRIGRMWFLLCLPLCALMLLVLGRISWVAHELGVGSTGDWLAAMAAASVGLLFVAGGLWRAHWSRACSVAACLAVYACLGLSTAPLNGPAGRYDAAAPLPPNARIAVPNNFNGQFERFEFLLPGRRFVPYDSEARASTAPGEAELNRLLAQHDAVVWLQASPAQIQPPCAPGCTLLGTRWELKGRHRSGEITLDNLWYPQQWLFRREWLLRQNLAN